MSEELIRRSSAETRQLVSAVARDLTTESWTDVVLYSKERVPLHLHRVVLSQSPLLHSLISSLSCCRGLCAHQATLHILLPDVPFEILTTVVDFLYNGVLNTREEDRLAIGELVEMLGFGGLILTSVMEERSGDFQDSPGSSPSHSGGIDSSEEDVETMDCDEGEIVETSGNEVEQDESSEIGEVVWAKVSGWRWWPGVVQKRVPTLLVDFFGEDHRGMNTSATLAKKNVRPFRGMLEYEKFKYSSLNNASGGELRKILKDFKPIGSEKWDEEEEEEEWRSSVEAASSTLHLPANQRLNMLQEINLNMKRAKESRSSNL